MPKDELAEFGRQTRESIKTSGAVRLANDLLDVYKEAIEVYKKKNKNASSRNAIVLSDTDMLSVPQQKQVSLYNNKRRI